METNNTTIKQIGKYLFNPDTRELYLKEKEAHIRLTWKESQLLKMLFDSLPDILSRNKALLQIWHHDNYLNGRSMDVYITKLRKYLKEDPNVEIINYSGKGFKLLIK